MKKMLLDLTILELWSICGNTEDCDVCLLKGCFCDLVSDSEDVYSLTKKLDRDKIIEYKNVKIKTIKNKTIIDRLNAI